MSRAELFSACTLCPRECKTDRARSPGLCGAGVLPRVAHVQLHHWEEPCISGTRGSGTVFFSGCNLGCVYCQNHRISTGGFGETVSIRRLADIFLELEQQGAHNINLVTPTPWLPSILDALDLAKPQLHIPVVYNCGGYEGAESIRLLKGYADIYLPDLKYYSDAWAIRFSRAPGYFNAASRAIREMATQTGPAQTGPDGLMRRGVLIRHLALPSLCEDSFALLQWVRETFAPGEVLISVMTQYTPLRTDNEYAPLNRRLSSYECRRLLAYLLSLGLEDGYIQDKSSAKAEYTPDFNLSGVLP